jgi:drug/metabolite transporter (DMT)-like permease
LSAVGLAMILQWKKIPINLGKTAIIQLLLTGSLTSLHWITFFASSKIANVSICLAGLATTTLWTSFIEPLIMKRALRWYEVALGLVIIAGLYLIFHFQFNFAEGLLVAILSALFVSLFSVINGKLAKKYHHITITFYEMLGAFFCTIILMPLYYTYFGNKQAITWLDFSPENLNNWLGILFLVLVCTIYAYAACVEIMQRLSAFTVNLSVNMEPIYGMIVAAIVLGEHKQMNTGFYIGALIILLSVISYPFLKKFAEKQSLPMLKN